MSLKKNNKIDMTEGPILGKMLLFAFPLMLSGLLQLLFNAADIIVVGKFAGDTALAAVGSNGAMINLIVNLFIGLSIGGNVLCARYFGARREKDVVETVHTSMSLAFLSGIVLTVIGLLFSIPLLRLMATPEKVLNLASVYLKIYFLGMPAQMVYNFGAALLRANGDTKRPLLYLTISGFINVALNLYFVIVLHMDVKGVAIATIVSQYTSAILIVLCMMKEESLIRLDLKKLCLKKDKVIQIVKIGIPAGLQGIMFSISNMVIQSSVNGFGEIAIAGNSAALNIEGFVYIALNAFGQAGMSFTSQNVGAGRNDRLKPIMIRAMASISVMGAIIGLLLHFFGEAVVGIYTDTPETIAMGMLRVSMVCVPYMIDGWMDGMGAIIRGLGYSFAPMIVTMLGVCVFRVVWLATVFKIPKYHTLECVYISYPISWIITVIIHFICYFTLLKRHFKVDKKVEI